MSRIDLLAGAVARLRVALAHVPGHRRTRDKPDRDLDLLVMTLKQRDDQLAALSAQIAACKGGGPEPEPQSWTPACYAPAVP